jgi:hypothetical protein
VAGVFAIRFKDEMKASFPPKQNIGLVLSASSLAGLLSQLLGDELLGPRAEIDELGRGKTRDLVAPFTTGDAERDAELHGGIVGWRQVTPHERTMACAASSNRAKSIPAAAGTRPNGESIEYRPLMFGWPRKTRRKQRPPALSLPTASATHAKK